jgi:hypothetical protein
MKFSDIDEKRWPELKDYLDTCLLPVTGLTGTEPPWLAAKALEELRDLLDCVEIPFYGRVVTYPAFHYFAAKRPEEELRRLCANLREAGFARVIAAFRELPQELREAAETGADLLLSAKDFAGMERDAVNAEIRRQVVGLWSKGV